MIHLTGSPKPFSSLLVGVTSWCKTSGSMGLHIYIPLQARYSYEQSLEFARLIATLVQRHLPKLTSLERPVSQRKGNLPGFYAEPHPGYPGRALFGTAQTRSVRVHAPGLGRGEKGIAHP